MLSTTTIINALSSNPTLTKAQKVCLNTANGLIPICGLRASTSPGGVKTIYAMTFPLSAAYVQVQETDTITVVP